MPLMSRFRKNKKPRDGTDEEIDALEDDEEDGFLMSTDGPEDAAAEKAIVGPAVAADPLAAPAGADAIPNPLEAASAGAGGDDPLDPAGAVSPATDASQALSSADPSDGPLEDPVPPPAVPVAEATQELTGVTVVPAESADDLLSAFRDGNTEGEMNEFTKDIEVVPMADLLEELRELRAMLPVPPSDAESGGA